MSDLEARARRQLPEVQAKAQCVRRQVGAIIYDSAGIPVSVGFNKPSKDGLQCSSDCPRATSTVEPNSSYDTGPGKCISVHAEVMAILDSTPGQRDGGTIAITHEPCGGCQRILDQCGMTTLVVSP